ncbi:MAG: mechanosensitive ion channel family protein [Candidatus Woesearchaeota archaeon]
MNLSSITGAAIAKVVPYLGNGYLKPFIILVIIVLTILAERIVRMLLHKSFEKSSKIIKVDHTQYTVLKHVISALIYMIGVGVAIFMIPTLKTLSISLFAGAGVVAVIVGFASQKAFSNIVSGIFIAIFKPFRVGDIIEFSNKKGTVEDITLRHTIIRNFENKRYVVPNSVISEEVIENFHLGDDKICRFVDFSISYDSNIDKAMKIMREEAMNHQLFVDNRTKEEKENKENAVNVRVTGFSDSSVNLRAWVWAKDPKNAYILGTDLNKSIKERFDKEGIEIPFPYRTIVYKKDMPRRRYR